MFLTLAQAQSPALLVEQAQLALLGGERPHHPDALGVLGDGVGDVGEPGLDQPRHREQPAAQLDADPQHERHRRQRDQRERRLMVAIITKATTATPHCRMMLGARPGTSARRGCRSSPAR